MERWDVDQAMHYLDGLDEAFRLLANSPLMCRERRELVPPVRIYHHAKHLIVYLAEAEATQITVVRVHHENMEINAQLKEPE